MSCAPGSARAPWCTHVSRDGLGARQACVIRRVCGAVRCAGAGSLRSTARSMSASHRATMPCGRSRRPASATNAELFSIESGEIRFATDEASRRWQLAGAVLAAAGLTDESGADIVIDSRGALQRWAQARPGVVGGCLRGTRSGAEQSCGCGLRYGIPGGAASRSARRARLRRRCCELPGAVVSSTVTRTDAALDVVRDHWIGTGCSLPCRYRGCQRYRGDAHRACRCGARAPPTADAAIAALCGRRPRLPSPAGSLALRSRQSPGTRSRLPSSIAPASSASCRQSIARWRQSPRRPALPTNRAAPVAVTSVLPFPDDAAGLAAFDVAARAAGFSVWPVAASASLAA